MSREMLHSLLDSVEEEDLDVLYKVILKFVTEVRPLPDELEAIAESEADFAAGDYVRHEEVNWD